MKLDNNLKQFDELIRNASKIIIIQADNPDGDSLGSALALEQILGDLGKDTYMYCRVDVPNYLKYLNGWDRVERDLPKSFDLSIIVDCSSITLLDNGIKNGDIDRLKKKPLIIIDHHQIEPQNLINFATLKIIKKISATGELIYNISKLLKYKINIDAARALAVAIMSDTLGLVTNTTTSTTIRTIAELVDLGVDLTFLDEARRNLSRKSPKLIKYKGELLQRIEFYRDNSIAVITISWEEIKEYSNAYNPSMLVMDEMRAAEGTMIAIAFKSYQDGRITAKIRSNANAPIAKELAERFNASGHIYASGFKINANQHQSLDKVKVECIKYTEELLNRLTKES
ncbi:MAG TPA: DHH family phosphoesterase [Candidatus Dormibacteraeota bacterium]|nr:DHH family phosphoesterase [Candidatus Dormibacteraeota bacterium]